MNFVISTLSPILSIHSLQWVRPPCSKPYRPKPNRRWGDILVSLLLLSGNVETNPGPVQQTSPETKTTFGSFNVRSAVHKAALLHDMISENKLDIMALQETWIPPDAPPAIVDDIAPPGFTAYHVHRPTRGGGLAIIIRGPLSSSSGRHQMEATTFRTSIAANPLKPETNSPHRKYLSTSFISFQWLLRGTRRAVFKNLGWSVGCVGLRGFQLPRLKQRPCQWSTRGCPD